MKNLNLLFILLLLYMGSFSQNELDSIWGEAKKSFAQGNYEKTISACIRINNSSDNNTLLLNSNLLIGESYFKLKQYQNAIEYLEKCSSYNKNNEVDIYFNLLYGDALSKRQQYKKAILKYQIALNKTPLSEKKKLAEISKDIGHSYYKHNDLKNAISWHKKSLNYYSKGNYTFEELNTLILIAKLQGNYGNYSLAKKRLKEALVLAKSLNKTELIPQIKKDIILLTNNELAAVSSKTEHKKDVERQQGELIKNVLIDRIKSLEEINQLSEEKQLVEYKAKAQADLYEKKILNEKLNSLEKEKSLTAAETTLKEEKIINEKKNIQLLGIAGIATLLAILLLVAFRYYMVKRKSNFLLSKKNEEILTQKRNIQIKAKQIEDSINYSHDIQKAFLPSLSEFKEQYPFSFIFHQPKEKVSGDFFWFKETKDNLYFAVADSTGHGVPGAFMSLVCYEILDTCVEESINLTPNVILQHILSEFTKKLSDETKFIGGMDISLIQIDKKKNILRLAS